MDSSLLVVVLLVGALLGLGLGAGIQDSSQNKMCRGEPKVVQTEDTIRTFTCTVELKK